MRQFDIVVAMDLANGIGSQGRLAWQLQGDLKHFRDLTTKTSAPVLKNAVIMGRKTWESLPDAYRPLPGRLNIVVTRNRDTVFSKDVVSVGSLDEALLFTESGFLRLSIENVFVIGGAQVYESALFHPACRYLYVTQILAEFPCDAFFPEFQEKFDLIEKSLLLQENGKEYFFAAYQRKPYRQQLVS